MHVVYVKPAQCPACRSTAHRVYKTCAPEADGTIARYAQCLDCAARFRLITRPPERTPPLPRHGNRDVDERPPDTMASDSSPS